MIEPLDAELATRYRPRLLAEVEALRTGPGNTPDTRRPVELDQQSVGRLSRMDAMQPQAMALAQAARRRAFQVAVQSALHRLSDAEFGRCADRGAFIGTERLDLEPVLMRCIERAS